MKKNLTNFMVLVVCLFVFSSTVTAAESPPPKGAVMPEINLAVPVTDRNRNYLGLPASGLFKISDIKSRVVLIQIFSMYCPHCQGDAHNVNRLYNIIENDPKLKNEVKLIGIGAGNSSYEVEVFEKTYDVSFPLFPDMDFSIHKMLGEVRTPYFLGIRMNNDGSNRVFYSKLGGVNNPEQFLDMILRLSGLK